MASAAPHEKPVSFADSESLRLDPRARATGTSKILAWLDHRKPASAVLGGAVMIVMIGILSYFTPAQLSCSLLYLIPILLMARVGGFRVGLFASVFATALWLFADLNSSQDYVHPVIPYWNALMRVGTFVVVAALVSAMSALNSHLEERVVKRTAELQAQVAAKRELEKNILEISDREQVRLGQDLHDGLCQQLVSAAFCANMLQDLLETVHAPAASDANRVSEMIDDSITQARNLARGLYPVRLEADGLEMALDEMASTMSRRFGIECGVECPQSLPPCKANTGIHLYRIAQESVMNAGKHSKTGRIKISLAARDGRIEMIVSDYGIGLDPETREGTGMGLRIMEYRARLIGATFEVNSNPGAGTKVICSLDQESFAI